MTDKLQLNYCMPTTITTTTTTTTTVNEYD